MRNCGPGGEPRTDIPQTSTTPRQELSVSANVTAGSCTIVFHSNANAGDWINFDDVSFTGGGGPGSDLAKGVDVSTLAKNEAFGGTYFDSGGNQVDPLVLLRDNGVDYARLKVWVNPADGYNNRARVLQMAQRIKALGMGLIVDFHYSDSWADPGQQNRPAAWQGLGFNQLRFPEDPYPGGGDDQLTGALRAGDLIGPARRHHRVGTGVVDTDQVRALGAGPADHLHPVRQSARQCRARLPEHQVQVRAAQPGGDVPGGAGADPVPGDRRQPGRRSGRVAPRRLRTLRQQVFGPHVPVRPPSSVTVSPARSGRNSSTVRPSNSRSAPGWPPGWMWSCSSTMPEKYDTTRVPPARTYSASRSAAAAVIR